MICLACDELTKHKTQTIQKRVKQTVLDKIAPKDPTAKRPGFYVLLDKPVGGLPSNDGVGRHPAKPMLAGSFWFGENYWERKTHDRF